MVSGSYLYTKGTHLPVYRNINLVPSGAYLADGRPIFSTSARVYQGFNNILSAESVGNSNYNALNMTLQKRCGRACQLYATYTWSHAIDDAPEQNNIDSSNFLSDPTNRRRDRANSLTDKRHVFNMTGVFLPEFHISHGFANRILNGNQLSLTIQAASGDLFNIGSNRQLNLDSSEPAAFQRPLFIGRNTFRAPAVFELNARYSRFFPIAERYILEFLAETTNLTNTPQCCGSQLHCIGRPRRKHARSGHRSSHRRSRPASAAIGASSFILISGLDPRRSTVSGQLVSKVRKTL